MGGFYLVTSEVGPQQRAAILRSLDQAMALQGLAPAERLTFEGHTLQTFGKRATQGGGHAWRDPADAQRFAAACGTLIVRGLTGAAALRSVVEQGLPDPQSADLLGGFCLLWAQNGTLELRTDPLGLMQVFRDRAGTVWSSSFVALASAIGARRLNTQAVYEYVFSEQPHGRDTIVEEIELHDCRCCVRWNGQRGINRQVRAIPDPAPPSAPEWRVAAACDSLRGVFASIGKAFGNRIDSGLSGGYDSRLVLAALRSAGVQPRLHVYGAAASDDVRIARQVAEACNLPIRHTDKSTARLPERESYLGLATTWLHAFDGYPADGIMGNGQDLVTRQERLADGALALNGGGGEVFRNFFYLPDRPYTRREILWSFYSQLDPACVTGRFKEHEYYGRLEAKLADCVGHERARLTRREVEWLYAAFRCRFWMSRNNSVNSRFGHYLTPLVAWPVVLTGLDVPLVEKNHGRFEARVIGALAPDLAKIQTAYGHSLVGPVPRKRIVKDYLTLLRPPRVRRWSFRVQARLARHAPPSWVSRAQFALGSTPERMSEYFRIDRVSHAGQLNRLYTLELLAKTLDLS